MPTPSRWVFPAADPRTEALAAELLEAAPEDIVVVGDGRLGVAGVPSKALPWSELARTASERSHSATGA